MIFIYIILGIVVTIIAFQIAAFTIGVLLALFRNAIGSAIIGGVLCFLFNLTSFTNGLIIGFVVGLIISVVQFFKRKNASYDSNYINEGDSYDSGGGDSYDSESSSYSSHSDSSYSHSYRDNDNDRYSYNDDNSNDYTNDDSNDYNSEREIESFRRGTSSRNCGCCDHYKHSGGVCEYHSEYTSEYNVCDSFRG